MIRSLLALFVALPIYYTLSSTGHWGAFACCAVLQLLAGLDFSLKEAR
jgi:hypothetical protein